VGAGGVVIQIMPGCEEHNIDAAEKLIANFTAVSTMIETIGIDGIVNEFFKDVEFTDYYPKYKCICSREFIERVLLSMGEAELRSAISEQGKIEVECHFCDKKYLFTADDVEELLREASE
jgi:molecular chaperone Hsp33